MSMATRNWVAIFIREPIWEPFVPSVFRPESMAERVGFHADTRYQYFRRKVLVGLVLSDLVGF